MEITPVRAVNGDIRLGESPVWSGLEQVLYWVDIDGHSVHRFDPASGVDELRPIGARPGACALTTEAGRLLVATEHQLVWLDWASGAVEPWVALEDPATGNRCNDGRVDPTGHMVVGTMWPDTSAKKATGSLYRIAPDGSTQTLLTDLGVPNGLAFDADRGLVYYADTARFTVLVADYDADTGERHNVRLFIDYDQLPGKPDGACLDADGCYWSASIHAWSIIRVTPDGRVDRRIELPVKKPTMPAFGGPDLSTLYVTSIGPSEPGATDESRDGFTAGDLLALDVGVQGRPETPFAGVPGANQ
ncbi:MAG: SMP-30/gluconolactonase/LRE family protein [Acidimicrobiales bacterium]